jgi:hypothetical protein
MKTNARPPRTRRSLLGRFLPHLAIAMSIALLALVAIDAVNDAMGFLVGTVFHVFLLIYALVAAATAACLLAERSRR